MTGKKSLDKKFSAGRHDLWTVLVKNIWIFPVGLVLFVLLIPFWTAGLPGSSIFNIEVTHEQMKFRLIHEQAIPLVAAACVGLGLAAGISLFGFVRDKRETTIFFSLGITRRQLYINRAAGGLLILAGCTGIPMAVSLWLNLHALGGYQGLVRNAVYLWAGIFVMAAFSFFAAAAAGFLSGTLPETLVYWAGIMGTPMALCYGGGLLLKKLYWGNAWGVTAYTGGSPFKPSLLEQYAGWDPLLFFIGEMEKHAQFLRPLHTDVPEPVSYRLLAVWTVALLLLIVAAGVLFGHRRAEAAGISGTNLFFSELVIILTGFLAFSMVFSFLYDYSLPMAVVMGLAGFYAVHIFWRRLLFSYACGIRKVFVSAVLQTAPVLLVCVLFHSGFFRSAQRFLEDAAITEASVSYVGAPGFLYEEASGSASGRGYYIMSQLTVKKQETIEKVKDLQKLFLDQGRMEKGPGKTETDMVVPYDICFSYKDADGGEHFWYYDRASYGQLEQLASIEEEEEIKQEQIRMFTEGADSSGTGWAERAYQTEEIFLTDAYFTGTFKLTLPDEERRQLLAAVGEDLERMDLGDRYLPENTTRAVLMFTGNGEADCRDYSYHLNNAFLYLTPAYTSTLAWLEENQLLSLLPEEPDIECIYLQKLDPYIGIHAPEYPMGMYFMSYCADTEDEFLIQKDFGKKYAITDEDKIQEIIPGLQNGYFMSGGGYLAAVKIKGVDRYRYLFLPAQKVPAFVRG